MIRCTLTCKTFFCSSLQSSNAFTTTQEHLKSSISVPIWFHKELKWDQKKKIMFPVSMHDPVHSPFQLFQDHQSNPNNHPEWEQNNRLNYIFKGDLQLIATDSQWRDRILECEWSVNWMTKSTWTWKYVPISTRMFFTSTWLSRSSPAISNAHATCENRRYIYKNK